MNTLEKLQKHLGTPVELIHGYPYKPCAPYVKCKDGSSMSVQAGEGVYCTPRTNNGPYTHVEVWLCGQVQAWNDIGDGEDPYAYIAIERVAEEIDRRGGFA